jgi:hypothetical protein
MLHVVKLHHWRTHDYSVHKATDNLHEALSETASWRSCWGPRTRGQDLRMRAYNTLPALKRRVVLNIRDELLLHAQCALSTASNFKNHA